MRGWSDRQMERLDPKNRPERTARLARVMRLVRLARLERRPRRRIPRPAAAGLDTAGSKV
jgi:hypothetical protein